MKRRNRQIVILLISVLITGLFPYPGEGMERVFHFSSNGKRDPFVPLVGITAHAGGGGIYSVLSIDDVVLRGTLINSDGSRSVVLNNEIMSEGDTIGSVSIESVDENKVTIIINNERFEKKLYEGNK